MATQQPRVKRIMTQPIVRFFCFLFLRRRRPRLPPNLLPPSHASPVHPPAQPNTTQNLIFRFLQSRTRVQVWLYEQADLRIEGQVIGFDEYMNLVLDGADEVSAKRGTRKPLGRILLKGDTVTLMRPVVSSGGGGGGG
jgi:small nuclear ribonucleoprotein E